MDRRSFVRASVGTVAMSACERRGSESFLGSWGLVSYEQVLSSGEVLRPFGVSPSGMILYLANGYMSAHLSVNNPARFASDDSFQATAEEAAKAWQAYFGYWGTFKVDAEKAVVVHRVEGSSFSNWIGTEQVRHFRFDGADRLIRETPSSSGLFKAIWQRKAAETNGRA
jgi:hypothetical protein